MSVSFIIGKPGAGKSLMVFQEYILPAILAGRHIYHNIPGIDCTRVSLYLRFNHKRHDITPYYVQSLLHDYSLEYLSENWNSIRASVLPAVPSAAAIASESSSPAPRPVYRSARAGALASPMAAKAKPPSPVAPVSYPPPTEEVLGAYFLAAIPTAPSGSLIVLDEAQKRCYINSHDWNTEKNKKFNEYCSIHRKLKHEVLIVTQDDKNVDTGVAGIREELIFLIRRERLGFFFKNSVNLKYYLGHQTILNVPYQTRAVYYNKALFGLYSSYSTNDGKKEVRKTRSVFFDLKLFAVLCIGFAFMIPGIPFAINLVKGKPFSLAGGQKPPVVKTAPPAPVAVPRDSLTFHLGTFSDYHCSDRLYVLRPNGDVDTIPKKIVPAYVCPKFDYVYSRGLK